MITHRENYFRALHGKYLLLLVAKRGSATTPPRCQAPYKQCFAHILTPILHSGCVDHIQLHREAGRNFDSGKVKLILERLDIRFDWVGNSSVTSYVAVLRLVLPDGRCRISLAFILRYIAMWVTWLGCGDGLKKYQKVTTYAHSNIN